MYHHCYSTDREGSTSQLFQPRHNPTTALLIPPSTTSLPVHLSYVSTAKRTNSDKTFLGTENSLPSPCSLLYVHPLLPASSVVCCFRRKLARRPLRWISCIARYLPVKVFFGFCIHSLSLFYPLPLLLHVTPATACRLSLILSPSDGFRCPSADLMDILEGHRE